MERGTLFQLRNLINRRNVSVDVKGSVNAFEDFLDVITIGHVLAAAMEYLGMSKLDEVPDPTIVNSSIWMEDDAERKKTLIDVSSQIVEKYVDLSTEFLDSACVSQQKGTIHAYACETLSLCLLLKEFKDCIREGDGKQRYGCVEVFLPHFSSYRSQKLCH